MGGHGTLWDYRNAGPVWDLGRNLNPIVDRGWFGDFADHGARKRQAPTPSDSLRCGSAAHRGHRGSLADLTGPLGPCAYEAASRNR
ncbi:hypothetical protein NOCARDAX2BIS_220164 [Nocardioides sp. AX2bis]|nr:hypothetical protein NOCARDAX2BIS_220164 [Nocardioides sp. AX2bis]